MKEKEVHELHIQERLIGLNEYVNENRKHHRKGAECVKKNEMIIRSYIRKQLKKVSIDYPVFIKYTWIERDRCRDKDNVAFAKKFIQDALVIEGVLQNDGWKHVTGFSDQFKVNKKNPGVQVELVRDDGGRK